MHNPPQPCAFIQEIYLGASSYGGRKLAIALGVAASTLNRLLLGQSGVRPEMALRLSKTCSRAPESMATQESSAELVVFLKPFAQLAGVFAAQSAIIFVVLG